MHNKIAADLGPIFSRQLAFLPANTGEWHKARTGTELQFALVPAKGEIDESALRMMGGSRRVSVFPLNLEATSRLGVFWASWHETWRKESQKTFLLLSAGWTVFVGPEGSRDKVQVLRAEWDQLPHKGSKEAGHPHWHFDHEVFLSVTGEMSEVAPALVEVTRDRAGVQAAATTISYIHLAMGAWNGREANPECWQRTYEGECGQLRDWCIKTLRYLKGQLDGN